MGTLIFDLDGTLSDPAVGIGRSLNYALEALGYRCITADEVFTFVGPPLDWAFRRIVPDASDETVRALVAKYRERYEDVGNRRKGHLDTSTVLQSPGQARGGNE
ncbi:HAD hydrolase-like protein [Luteitalea sp.]|uniref:HAD hydrolase-like protein n=1 Tax=Luteitalea sp. TaxID=2004800 RepID=UPI0025C07264|nr:HAD hydrolase-like protein [Luteitalea sp.]